MANSTNTARGNPETPNHQARVTPEAPSSTTHRLTALAKVH